MTFKTTGKTMVCALIASICMGVAAAGESQASRQTMFREGKLFKGRVTANTKRAETLLLRGKYDQAETSFRNAIARNSKDVDARSGLGMALAMQFKLDGADDQLDRALKLDPTNPLACTGKAMVLLNRLQSSSNTYIRNKNSMLSQAEEYCRRAVSYDPQLPEANYMMGVVNKEQGKLADSQRALARACDLDPRYSQAFSALGMTNLAQNKVGDATANFKQAIAINSKNSSAHFGLGRAAEAAYKKGATMPGGEARAKRGLANVAKTREVARKDLTMARDLYRKGQVNTAVDKYRDAIYSDPRNPESRLGLAEGLQKQKEQTAAMLRDAAFQYRAYVALQPNLPEKERSKIQHKIERVEAKAFKLENKGIAAR